MLRSVTRPRRRRLQRDKDFTGERLSSFREVFVRHGLPGLVLAVCLFAVPGLPDIFIESVSRAVSHVGLYLLGAVVILIGLSAYTWSIDRQWRRAQLGWVVYLGALSFWEEWVFRLAIPQILEGLGASIWLAAGVSAVLFGGLHYFTLRWKWYWCVGACFGGLYFSHQMELHGDLLLVAAIHWIATSINTPRPPSPSSSAAVSA